MRCFVFLATVLASGVSAAPVEDTVAVQFVALQVDEAQSATLRKIIDQELGGHGLAAARPEAVNEFLRTQPDDTCISDYPTCLPLLAKASGAGSSLLFTVAPYGPHILVTAKWMSRSGKLIYDIAHREFPKDRMARSGAAVKKAVLAAAAEVLATDHSAASLPAAETPPPTVHAPPDTAVLGPPRLVPTREPEHRASYLTPLRWVGIGAGVLGVASLVTSGAVALGSRADQQTLRDGTDSSGAISPGSDGNLGLARSLNQRSTVVTATLIAGCVLTAGGAALVVLAPSAEAPASGSGATVQVSGLVAPGSAGVFASGTF